MTRYYGIFASHHRLRARIIPKPQTLPPGPQLALPFTDPSPGFAPDASPRPRRIGWANLLARVFAIDVTLCRKLRGYFGYYGITGNSAALGRFRFQVQRTWHKWLSRRSGRANIPWEQWARFEERYPLPPARVRRPAIT